MPDMTTDIPVLHVCTTCRTGLPLAEGETPPGRTMLDAVAALVAANPVVAVREVACLASCDDGCAATGSDSARSGLDAIEVVEVVKA